jgi:hypothetical protein
MSNLVLREDWEEAMVLMKRMGKDALDKEQYRVWPLFRWFRQTDQFKEGYLALFGEEFKIHSSDGSESDREEPTETEEAATEEAATEEAATEEAATEEVIH